MAGLNNPKTGGRQSGTMNHDKQMLQDIMDKYVSPYTGVKGYDVIENLMLASETAMLLAENTNSIDGRSKLMKIHSDIDRDFMSRLFGRRAVSEDHINIHHPGEEIDTDELHKRITDEIIKKRKNFSIVENKSSTDLVATTDGCIAGGPHSEIPANPKNENTKNEKIVSIKKDKE